MQEIGYDRPLFVQPFDHRGSFTKKFFGLQSPPALSVGDDQRNRISEVKGLIYRGLQRAIELGVAKEHVGVLVDVEWGLHVIHQSRQDGIPLAICVERSGQPIFDFEYGSRWQDHLRLFKPEIVKCLVRWHPHDDAATNREQGARLAALSEYVHDGNDHHLMFELLVPALTDEEKAMGSRYDHEVRPQRMIEAIHQIQDQGVEPDIWKIEGLETREQAEQVAAACRNTAERATVGCILLGRGSDKEQVHKWLRVAAPVPGYIGFAVGRTNFSDPVKAFLADPSQQEASIQAIAENYKGCVDVWLEAAG
ncbi:MAG: DUF2090 domain-containing protein [Acidobacteriota bacterium]